MLYTSSSFFYGTFPHLSVTGPLLIRIIFYFLDCIEKTLTECFRKKKNSDCRQQRQRTENNEWKFVKCVFAL